MTEKLKPLNEIEQLVADMDEKTKQMHLRNNPDNNVSKLLRKQNWIARFQ
jgi:hypothetical protein